MLRYSTAEDPASILIILLVVASAAALYSHKFKAFLLKKERNMLLMLPLFL